MTALVILAAVAAALVLLGLVRLDAAVGYAAQRLRLRIRVGDLQLQAYREKAAPLAQLRRYLPLVADAAGRLRRKIRIDRFCLDFTAAAADPASAALLFGGANAAVGMIWPLVEQNFNVKERRIRTRVDFTAQRPDAALSAAATLTAAQALSLALRLAVGFWKEQSQSSAGDKAPARQKEAV